MGSYLAVGGSAFATRRQQVHPSVKPTTLLMRQPDHGRGEEGAAEPRSRAANDERVNGSCNREGSLSREELEAPRPSTRPPRRVQPSGRASRDLAGEFLEGGEANGEIDAHAVERPPAAGRG